MKRIFCDHCGNECRAPLRDEWYRTEIRLPKVSLVGHLCEDCAEWLRAWFKDELPRAENGQPRADT